MAYSSEDNTENTTSSGQDDTDLLKQYLDSAYPEPDAVQKPKSPGQKVFLGIPRNIPLLTRLTKGRVRVPKALGGGRGFNVNLSGERLDRASQAVADALKDMPEGLGGGQRFFAGLAGGYAGSRIRNMEKRKEDYETALKEREGLLKRRYDIEDYINKKRVDSFLSGGGDSESQWIPITDENRQQISDFLGKTGRMMAPGTTRIKETELIGNLESDGAGSPGNFIDVSTPEKLAEFQRNFPNASPEALGVGRTTGRVPYSFVQPKGTYMTPDVVEYLSGQYTTTGQFPPGTTRNPALLQQIVQNLVRQGYTPQQAATQAIIYKTGATSYNRLVLMKNNAEAFINTAEANLRIMNSTLRGIPSTRVMALNDILRGVKRQFGDEKVVAFKTALEVVRPEFQRILNSPGMTGQNTVRGKEEINAVLSENFSVGQLRIAMSVLSADSRNRINAYDAMAQDVLQASVNSPYGTAPALPMQGPDDNAPLPDTEPGIYARRQAAAKGSPNPNNPDPSKTGDTGTGKGKGGGILEGFVRRVRGGG